ncbi:4-hydroxy-tetrahydrodipicolinate reductase [Syntrophobacter fumaroxidans]|uniref:4-hydroxy-tetrahydrodipicolinate reductase n=1 Tax=Syntrophobacter fumaroxidans (strain DSM 10017 / MPOB) TaxID=335543 RepID=DAPB_SYNFM|nr:4-hydroxy-tetrahydrodipicolinate reductase [Syntrophobacter fumaroxidans]A0LEA6.1 RecName: Full=4-hydroxy-tetrahydrodipicolinate reductase; Short=HTPA reductase [Syntrophobacter fumaroxidans MPOB]ABK15758.1 dihydrodipicolinate reductase [Syntrophobacter fumaroxidans MPOB]
MVRAAVAGIAGRMGSRIAQLIRETDGIELAGGFEHSGHQAVNREISEIIGGSPTGLKVTSHIAQVLDTVDVVLDFTLAAASLEHLRQASARGKAMVIGSTGFAREQLEEAEKLAGRVPCVISPNMSMGVNVLFKVVGDVARLLGESFDVEIIEAHHRLKKDAPSGTALKLAQVAAGALGRNLEEVGVYARRGLIGERTGNEIGIQTIRGGDIVGEHTVMFAGSGERIEIVHRAQSRDNFARGAIRAALWVVRQPPGLYGMDHVLGMK